MSQIAKTPEPPYYAVIFSSHRTGVDEENYQKTANRMLELAANQDGYLGFESAGGELGITISYWKDLKSIKSWKLNAEHLDAQSQGHSKWYKAFKTRISKIERDYGMEK